MAKTLLSLLLLIVAVALFAVTLKTPKDREKAASARFTLRIAALVILLFSVINFATGMFYTQDVAEVIIIKNWDGRLIGQTDDAGFHTKMPWQNTIVYNTRNMLINFYGSDVGYSYDGGNASGPQVTVNDKSGASANIDIQIVYSLDPSAAMELYANYGTQTNYTSSYLSNDLRSVARKVSGRFDTITMLTDRSQYQNEVQATLSSKWEEMGLHVEQVQVQEVRYPEEITSKYAEAQAAEIAKAQALNEQETAKVKAETKKIEAQIDAETRIIDANAEAEANRIINESLTKEVLQQKYIDALTEIGQSGNLVVVPENSQPIISTGGASSSNASVIE